MFSISIMIGSGQFRLMYKTEAAAILAYAALNAGSLPMTTGQQEIADDFGQKLFAKAGSIHGLLYEDMDQSKLAAVELTLMNARIQNMAMKQAQSDPSLRANMAVPQQPILSPMGNSRFS